MSSVGARTLSSAQRKEVLDRLILERQSKPSLSSAPSTESIADKRERVQQLLRERRASHGMPHPAPVLHLYRGVCRVLVSMLDAGFSILGSSRQQPIH